MNFNRKFGLAVVCLLLAVSILFAYNPPTGGDSAHTVLSPDLLGGGTSVTGGAFSPSLPGELAVNPALGAGEQRIILDASYAALVGTGSESGLGHVLNLGALYPTRWGVIAGSLGFLGSPFDSLPLGWSETLHASVSKDITEKFYVGTGITASAGSGWGLSADLGMLYRLGTVGFMSDARIGAAMTGLGRTFTPGTDGINGGNASGFPSMITPRAGFGATLVSAKDFKLGGSIDLSAPTFQNLVLDTGLEAVFKDMVTLRTGWNFNLTETVNDRQTYLPSFGLGVKLKIDSKDTESFLARNGWGQSEITPSFAVKPFYNDIYAFGGGVNARLGVIDRKAPAIAVDYPAPVYISPNNDGVQDELLFGVKITDERFVLAWAFVIEDATGNVVRTIANKEIRPEMQDISSFWKLLTRVKQGIELPETLRWDGIMDSGETAPDGTYTFYVTAADDNKNRGESEKFTLHIDNTVPVVTLAPPSGTNAMIFSPDGDGNKDTFTIGQTGSEEDKWTAVVLNNAQAPVRTLETTNAAPAAFVWDGKNDSMAIVADGVYAYRIVTTDRAGNTAEAKVDNIILDTEKPSINISIDINAFSPNGDGARDNINLAPSIPVLNGLIGWDVAVSSRAGETVRRYSGTGPARTIGFDGKNDEGTPVSEGDYQAVISARYINGYAPVARSPYFNLDVTAPEAQVRASGAIFSPVGDGKLDTVTFTQSTSTETLWTAQIFALDANETPAAKALKTVPLGSVPANTLVWDGRDDGGKLAPDGKYAYRLTSTDRAGNTGYSNLAQVELNTEKADLILQASLSAFSPNGDGVKDSIVFTPILKAATAIERYTLAIKNSEGAVIRTIAGKGRVPPSITWNRPGCGDRNGRTQSRRNLQRGPRGNPRQPADLPLGSTGLRDRHQVSVGRDCRALSRLLAQRRCEPGHTPDHPDFLHGRTVVGYVHFG